MKLRKIEVIIIIVLILTVLSYGEEVNTNDIKKEASFLYSVQSYNDGVDILEKNYNDNKNDIEYVFLLGKGYYKLQKYNKAAEYFERALNINSNLTGIRMKYADSLAESHKVEKAKKNYKILLEDENLSEADKKIIEKKLEKFSEKKETEKGKSLHESKNWNLDIKTDYIIENYLDSIPENLYYKDLGVPFYSKKINREVLEKAVDFSLSGNVLLDIPKRKNVTLKLSSGYNTRQYKKYDLFSYDNLSLGITVTKSIGNFKIKLPWEKEITWLNGVGYSDTVIFNPNLIYLFNNRINVGTGYKYMRYIYQGKEKSFSYEKDEYGSRSQHIYLLLGYDWNDILKINTKYSIIKENSSIDKYDNYKRKLGYELTGNLFFGIGYKFENLFAYKNYRKHNSFYEKTRKDLEKEIKFSLLKNIYDYDLIFQYRLNDVDSNININDRNSKDISFTLKFEI